MFSIPNEGGAVFPPQSEIDKGDIEILVAALGGTGVVSGCAVTEQATPDMTLAVASGSIVVAGTVAAVTAGNVTITTANGSNPRFDLVVVSSAGVKSVVAGTPATVPVYPAIPANSVVLAAVYVPAGDTAINANQITDKRAQAQGSSSPPTVKGLNFGPTPQNNTGLISSRAYFVRIPIPAAYRINRILVPIHTASGNLDAGLYADDGTGLAPSTKILAIGSTAMPGSGPQPFTISEQSGQATVVWAALAVDNGSARIEYGGEGSSGSQDRFLCKYQDSAFPLPNSVGTLVNQSWYPAIWVEYR